MQITGDSAVVISAHDERYERHPLPAADHAICLAALTLKDDRNRLIYGFSAPLLILVGAASLVVMTESGAAAEGFAPIVVLVMIIIAVPVTVIVNMIVVPVASPANAAYFTRGMILPTLTIAAVLVYYTGFWDDVIDPLLPQRVDKIQTASSSRIGADTYESFYVVTAYQGTVDELDLIDQYIRDYYQSRSWESSSYGTLKMTHYFVPAERYDPIDDAVSRDRAIAVYRHTLNDDGPGLERVIPAADPDP